MKNIFECLIWALQFAIYCWLISSCNLIGNVKVTEVCHKIDWSSEFSTFTKVNGEKIVAVRPEISKNIFEQGIWW